jgi:F-type H+-transporting ATPase subunit a
VDILEEFELHPLIIFKPFGIDLSINKAVIMIWLACIILFVLFMVVTKRLKIIPSPLQSFIELFFQYLRNDVAGILGQEKDRWFPYIATLFFFILTCNLLGLFPGGFTATSNINVTGTLAVFTFIIYHFAGISKFGVFGYLKTIVPSGLPIIIQICLFPIEIVAQLARPFSLAIRLFANMFAGHSVLLVFLSLILFFKSFLIAPFPLLGATFISGFEIFVSLIQAFVFTYLSTMYIAGAISEHH